MKKSRASNLKISQTILCLIFSILFIFTALNFQTPLIAQAAPVAPEDLNMEYDASKNRWVFSEPMGESGEDGIIIPDTVMNGTDTVGSLAPTYTYWAGDSHRCGLICYVIDLSTNTMDRSYAPYILVNNRKDTNLDYWLTLVNASKFYLRTGDYVTLSEVNERTYTVPTIAPVFWSGDSWSSNEAAVEADLLGEDETYTYKMLKYWKYYGGCSLEQVQSLAEKLTQKKVALAFETVSAQSFFTGSEPDAYTMGGSSSYYGFNITSGFAPVGQIVRCFTTEYGFAQHYNTKGISGLEGSTLNWKWFQATAGSMILKEDEAGIVVPTGNTTIGSITSSEASTITNGYGIIITHISAPPIHTFGGSTPGNTETPDPNYPTTGDCTIKKLYYTQKISSDGTIIEEATDYFSYTQTETTNYISIDNEEGYEIEGWKTSDSSSSLTTKEQFTSISASRNGSSSETITLDADTGEKYLYVLLKKTEIDDTPHEDYDFRLEQSQITKRVTFLEGMGPANTPDLITHNFTWTAPAPSQTSCTAHGGKGHHLDCDTEFDTEGVPGVPHNHADHSDEISYYKCPYTYSCAAGCKKPHKHHTHDDGCIGYKKLTHTTLCPSGCTTRHTHHFSHTDSCYTVCNKVWDVAPKDPAPHTHRDECYNTPCTTWQWTDNTTQLGITLDTTAINNAVVSKNWSVTYNTTTVNTIESDDKYYNTNTSTRSGTGENTQSLSQFNYITVLFRGQDHLTLADWKNTATGKDTSYLTNIAYDSAYNFKSANTPQGTRKSGTEYTETFAAKFINRSPDMSTTYKATVGAYGICSAPSSNYSFNSAYTIPNINVNIQVFWAQGISPSASGTLPSTQTAGSATFYPYIKMRYDNNTLTDRKVYVLGQTRRTVTFYDYASVGISGGDKDLTITSNQWSTHSDAMNNILSKFSGRTLSTTEENRIKSSVLPGGATLSLSVNSSNTRQIVVTTIQAYLTGSGKTQVDVTGGNSSLPTDRTQLESIHTELVSSVSGVASQAYIAQYICTGAKLNSSEMTGAQFVKAGDTFNGNGTTFSVDTKYHLFKIK